jgi:NAD(P)-dependent dehydrogenase (short-subunit alcohol dehydrogenase family)
MSYQKVALVLGSGPNVGLHVSRAFAAKGYKVALASRSSKTEESASDLVHFQVDLSDPSSVPELFTKVKDSLGTPSVVVYNGK